MNVRDARHGAGTIRPTFAEMLELRPQVRPAGPVNGGIDPIAQRERFLRELAGGRRDFAGADLRGLYAPGVEVRGCCFAGARLGMAILTGADLRECDMRGADATSIELSMAKLDGANWGLLPDAADPDSLHPAVLHNVRAIRSSWDGCDLEDAYAVRGQFVGASMMGVMATGLVGLEANFTDANLRAADLSDAQLQRAVFTSADLRGASLLGAALQFAAGTGAQTEGADLRHAEMFGAVFEQLRAPEDIDQDDFRNLTLLEMAGVAEAGRAGIRAWAQRQAQEAAVRAKAGGRKSGEKRRRASVAIALAELALKEVPGARERTDSDALYGWLRGADWPGRTLGGRIVDSIEVLGPLRVPKGPAGALRTAYDGAIEVHFVDEGVEPVKVTTLLNRIGDARKRSSSS